MAKETSVAELVDAELFERLRDGKEELFNLRFQHVTGQLDNYARIKQVKKEIARLHTELRAREIAAAEALEAQAQEKVDG
jgi:large subunit ribosomal protein L29